VVAVVFENIACDLAFCVLYDLTHLNLNLGVDRKSKRASAKLRILHWICLGFLVAISFGDFLTYILGTNQSKMGYTAACASGH
jgi:hypothetical protein